MKSEVGLMWGHWIQAAALIILCVAWTSEVTAKGEMGDGLLVHIQRDISGDFAVVGATIVSRYVDRANTGAPVQWVVEVVGPSGEVLWDGLIPAVTLPHLAGNPDGSREFSILIPSRFESGRVRLRDDTGAEVFEFPIDDALAESARESRQGMLAEIEAMRRGNSGATQTIHSEGKRAGQSIAAAQMQWELARLSAIYQPDIDAAAAGVWQDSGDLPVFEPPLSPSSEVPGSHQNQPFQEQQLRASGTSSESEVLNSEMSETQRVEIEISRELERNRLSRLGLLMGEYHPPEIPKSNNTAGSTASDTVTLSGQVVLADGGSLSEGFWSRLRDENGTFDWQWIGVDGGFEFEIPAGRSFELELQAPPPFLRATFPVQIDRDTTQTYRLERGALLVGAIETSDGEPLSDDEFWIYLYRDNDFVSSHLVQQSGFEMALEPDVEYELRFRPPIPYLPKEQVLTLSNDAVLTFEVERGAVLDGKLVTSDGEDFAESFWISFSREDFSWFGWAEVDETGRFTILLEPGVIYMVDFRVPVPYLGQFRVPVSLASDGEHSFPVERGAVLDGQLVTSDGGEFSESFSIAFFRENENLTFNIGIVEVDGRFQTVLEPNARYSARISPPVPYLGVRKTFELAEDASRLIEIQRGVVVRLGVFNEDGATELAAQIGVSQSGASRWFFPESTSRLPVVIEPEVPAVISVVPDDEELMLRNIPVEARTVDFNLDVVLPRGGSVSGVVEDRNGEPVGAAQLRFYKGNEFVKSVETLNDGSYELLLPKGSYQVHSLVGPGRRLSYSHVATVFDADRKPVSIDHDEQRLDIQLARRLHGLTIKRFVPQAGYGLVKLTFSRIGPDHDLHAYSWSDGSTIQVMQGSYDLTIDYPGFAPAEIRDLDIESDQVLDLAAHLGSSQAVWQGVLKDDLGQPVADVYYRIYDNAHQFRGAGYTDSGGEFILPLGDGLYAEFGGGPGFPADGGLTKKMVDLDLPMRSIEGDITLDKVEFPDSSPVPGEVVRLFGDRPVADAYNILFLGDGYTNISETFTDRNGNGVWDGVLYVDIDSNGVWDRGEPVAAYGDATYDYSEDDGVDLGADNEPFVDLNQDGFPNFNDREVFAINVRNFMRALLGSHVWDERPELFAAHALFTPSAESGTGVINEEDEPLIQRDTVFSSNLHTERWTLGIDYQKARSMAAEALPEHDLVVVLLNQPVPMGRANSFIVYNGGMKAGSPASTTPHHEMGHAFGFLADEYQEFPKTYEGSEPSAVNVTTMSDPAAIPWAELLAEDVALPTAPMTGGDGLFTGGLYHQGGIFRSTENSTMRGNTPRFNAISEQAVRNVFCERFEVDCPSALGSGLFWFNAAAGDTRVWRMDGVTRQGVGYPPGIADSRWALVGIGDFNGDNETDFFWRAPGVGAGRNRVWLLDGQARSDGADIPAIGAGWTFFGAGDFDGDGRDDLFWRQTAPVSGQNRIWTMNGTQRTSGSAIPLLPGAQWVPVGVGDMNADGRDDIIWRNQNRPQTRVWLMDGFSIVASRALPLIANAWEVAGVADFDADGKSDLLWRNPSTGHNRIWLMNGLAVKRRGMINLISLDWQVGGVGDLDLDGKADIVWRNAGNGQNRVWLMDGLVRKRGSAIPLQNGANWRMIGVGKTAFDGAN